MLAYYYTDKEIDEIVKSMKIIVDTREQQNKHILDYFNAREIGYVNRTLRTGDYGALIPANEKLGILKDIYLPGRVERKAHIDELTGNLQKDKKTAFENELRRSQDIPFSLIVEDINGYEKLIKGDYRSKFNPLALLGLLNSYKAKYNFEIVYLDNKYTGNWIYYHFYYQARNLFKNQSR